MSLPLFEKNAAAFMARHRVLGSLDWKEVWSGLGDGEKQQLLEGAEKGRWLYKGKLLHSERDPAREAARAADTLAGAEALLCISAGAGYLLSALPAGIRRVLIIERDPFCLAAFILSGRFRDYHGEITVFADPLERADALEEILPWLQGKNLKRTHIYYHAPLLQIDKAGVTRVYERVQALFEKRSVNQATVVKFQALWNKNIFLNRRLTAASGSMKEILATKPPEAIVLAGAGPSLNSSFADMKRWRGRFVLFAVDTALIPLVRADIFPDYVFSADPQWVNHYFVQTAAAGKVAWVMDPVVCPAIPRFAEGQGARLFFWNNVFLADEVTRSEDRGDVAHGGSVSTNAFDVAMQWLMRRENDPPGRLILVGQDLSFSNRQAHAQGAVLEAQVYTRNNRLYGMEIHNFRQMTAMPVLWQKGIKQDKVRTNGKLRIFHDWFEARAAECDRARIRLINATADGAALKGFVHEALEKALEDVADHHAMPVAGPAAAGRPAEIPGLLADLALAQKLMLENSRLCHDSSPAAVQKMNANDDRFKKLGIAKDITGLNAQAIILKITEQGGEADAYRFYSAMAAAARAVRHWAAKAFPLGVRRV
jgi:hypothetical protein